MPVDNQQSPGIATLLLRLARTALGAVQNRFELLALEWQQERLRLAELLVRIVAFLFLAVMGVLLFTATILLVIPESARVYVAAGFTLIYITGAVLAWFGVRGLLKRDPFQESIDQARKDREWLKSLD
jgi:uncharacterized membrane protein YqjE